MIVARNLQITLRLEHFPVNLCRRWKLCAVLAANNALSGHYQSLQNAPGEDL